MVLAEDSLLFIQLPTTLPLANATSVAPKTQDMDVDEGAPKAEPKVAIKKDDQADPTSVPYVPLQCVCVPLARVGISF